MDSKKYNGLSDEDVEKSRLTNGENVLTPVETESLFVKFIEKFTDPLIIILLIAGVLSVGISCYKHFGEGEPISTFFEPVGIFLAIFLATGLSFLFEYRADKAFKILNQVNDNEPVRVIRNGNTIEIPKKEVVVGDIVIISTGDEVPADAELLEATALNIDESTLTGEPICHKTTIETDFDPNATFPSNHIMRGTKVMDGHGVCKVFAVGDKTENGKVFKASQIDDSVKTPLNEQLEKLSQMISKASYSIAALILIIRTFIYFFNTTEIVGLDLIQHLLNSAMISVTLIVVAVPEGLPMAVSLSLAYSMRRMLKTNNLVRKMHACETMGATTVICTDKTGTLTQNQMNVFETQFIGLDNQKLTDNQISNIIKESISVNSTATIDRREKPYKTIGNPTEGALLLWLDKNKIDYEQIRNNILTEKELPFSTESKYMAIIAKSSATGKRTLYLKGAPEIIYKLCSHPKDESDIINSKLEFYQNKAMRTIGFAYKELDDEEEGIKDGKLTSNNLTFLGFAAISDPIRADVPDAIKECLNAGINIKIVTGDTSNTAKEIGKQIGIWQETDNEENIITGPEFETLSDNALLKRISSIKIISRARPLDKKRLVETLQKTGNVVAVTGDGTNDAPALKAAHVGLSMGDGTAVAKEASDITIIDNSFSSICRAVLWGRSLYQNIRRFILFQMTVNVVACLIVLAGAFIGVESPLSVTQMLWVNLIMDTFAAVALASLPPNHEVMLSKPRDRKRFIIDKPMASFILIVGTLFFLFLIGLLFLFRHANISDLTDILNTTYSSVGEEPTINELSIFFTTFVMMQFWNMFNARAFQTGKSALNLKGCKGLILIAIIILIGQIIIVEIGGPMFNVQPISLKNWITIIISTSFVLWIGEIFRLIRRVHI